MYRTLGAGVYTFGLSALIIILVCVASCVLSEFVFQKLMKQKSTVSDLSAVVTGLILAVNLSSDIPVWMAALGSIFAIVIVKQLFGGIGQNFMNPALAARVFLLISFTKIMTAFPEEIRTFFPTADAVSSATPMAIIKTGGSVSWFDMIFNTHSGCIGEASALAVLAGAAYLLFKKVITLKIPLTYILSAVGFVVLIQLFSGNPHLLTTDYVITQLFGGGLLVGAFYMANDYVTSPITPVGQIVYALLLGLMTALIRVVSPSSEGVSYAIIIGNVLTPLIEKFTVHKPLGRRRKVNA